jgi:hypothetical protein
MASHKVWSGESARIAQTRVVNLEEVPPPISRWLDDVLHVTANTATQYSSLFAGIGIAYRIHFGFVYPMATGPRKQRCCELWINREVKSPLPVGRRARLRRLGKDGTSGASGLGVHQKAVLIPAIEERSDLG